MQHVNVTQLLYAADLVIIAKTEGDLQNNLNVWNEGFKEYQMKINSDKTEVLVVSRNYVNSGRYHPGSILNNPIILNTWVRF